MYIYVLKESVGYYLVAMGSPLRSTVLINLDKTLMENAAKYTARVHRVKSNNNILPVLFTSVAYPHT